MKYFFFSFPRLLIATQQTLAKGTGIWRQGAGVNIYSSALGTEENR